MARTILSLITRCARGPARKCVACILRSLLSHWLATTFSPRGAHYHFEIHTVDNGPAASWFVFFFHLTPRKNKNNAYGYQKLLRARFIITSGGGVIIRCRYGMKKKKKTTHSRRFRRMRDVERKEFDENTVTITLTHYGHAAAVNNGVVSGARRVRISESPISFIIFFFFRGPRHRLPTGTPRSADHPMQRHLCVAPQ